MATVAKIWTVFLNIEYFLLLSLIAALALLVKGTLMTQESDTLTVAVRSRSSIVGGNKGYHWVPNEPLVVREIETHSELVSDFSPGLVLWLEIVDQSQKKNSQTKQKTHLIISGIDSNRADSLGRQIKHHVCWSGGRNCEQQFRSLIIQFLQGGLLAKLAMLITPSGDNSFSISTTELLNLANETIAGPLNGNRSNYKQKSVSSDLNAISLLATTKIPLKKNKQGLILAAQRDPIIGEYKKHNQVQLIININSGAL